MKQISRTKTVYMNSVVTLFSQILQVVLGFVIRKLFLIYIGVEYLGYNSVFLNILQLLNLADLGIGVAITSFLYRPLATNNKEEISALMYIYRRIYSIIGIIVLIIGLLVVPFLSILVPDAKCSFSYLVFIYLINLAGTVSTYFLAYKRTLIFADQKAYIANVVDTTLFFIAAILQLVGMKIYPSYIVYISINLLRNIISNVVLSIKSDRIYGKSYENANKDKVAEYQPQIVSYIKDVFISRIGAVIYYSTDNIILSVLKGSLLTGYLSNYTLITTQLNTVVIQILSSVQGTFGNYISTTEDNDAKKKMTDNYFCVNFCIGNFCMICFALLAQHFIKLVFGENMLLTFSTAVWLGINLMLTFLIQLPSQVFTIYKLFRYDRPIIIVSAILNIIISASLVKVLGINGVLIGTFITSLIYLFSRFYIIARYVYEVKYSYYVKKIIFYGVISIATFGIAFFSTKNMCDSDFKWFVFRTLIVGLIAVLSTAFFLSFTREFDFLKSKLLPEKICKYAKSKVLGILCVTIVVISIIFGGGNINLGVDNYRNTVDKIWNAYKISDNVSNNIFHLSFDDTIFLFKDLKENDYDSIFDNPTLSWYKNLHDKYGIKISCYVFYEYKDFNLSQVSDKYRREFMENSSWLRFGFHTINEYTNYQSNEILLDYEKTINELERIVGSEAIDNIVRLHMFQGSYEEIRKISRLKNQPVIGLLTSDDCRQNYYLDDNENSYIYSHDEYFDKRNRLLFIRTDFRTENVENIDEEINELSDTNQLGDLVVFSHEWMQSDENKEKIEMICKYAAENDYEMSFFEDILH